jgi:hypothetical protein
MAPCRGSPIGAISMAVCEASGETTVRNRALCRAVADRSLRQHGVCECIDQHSREPPDSRNESRSSDRMPGYAQCTGNGCQFAHCWKSVRVLGNYSGISSGQQLPRERQPNDCCRLLFVQPESVCQVHRRSQGSVTLYCGASLSFDAENEVWKVGTMVQVPRQRNVCVQYRPRDPRRQPRCIRSVPETYYVSEQ